MCGACGGTQALGDWARPLTAEVAARSAVATAVTRLAGRRAGRIAVRPGGWSVLGVTGALAVCDTLTELVARVRADTGRPAGSEAATGPDAASGRLTLPGPDHRRGVVVALIPDRTADTEGPAGTPLRTGPTEAPTAVTPTPGTADTWTVGTEAEARAALKALADGPHATRHYLAGLTGVTAPWGAPAVPLCSRSAPDSAADLVVWVEWARQEGRFDDAALTVRVPLTADAGLDVEVRAGWVVRAVPCRAIPRRAVTSRR
ncbi:hypothetical protein [Streptomyces acidicola]|uniref:Uncharacterized protein n=1 Tax=Streptomyces acidicola TaxID=2596892 RepID=A0A5N8WT62_9ACTN|nr:hypothetical protein [Streptomyces acidicola]MPY49425.1 hypothetical protein [Streptomyces acidicola]